MDDGMESGQQQEPIDVDFIADLACPWCYLGLVRLDRARESRPHLAVRLRWWPFLLNPQMPVEGMDRTVYLRAKFGGDAAHVYERIAEAGRQDGIPFAFDLMKRTPNTVLAQRLVLNAESQGKGEDLIRVLFRALFEEGRDIGHLATLLELAEAAGLERAEAEAFLQGSDRRNEIIDAHRRAERLGVRGVPVFIVDREHAIAGAQPPEVLAELLDTAAAARRGVAAA